MKFSTPAISALFLTLLLLSGCTSQPRPESGIVVDRSLPPVRINGHLSDDDAVAFEWKPVDNPKVAGVRIYRDNPPKQQKSFFRIAQIDGRLSTHYVDGNLEPATAYHYRFTTFDADGKESVPDRTLTAKTLKLPEPVSFFTATHALARRAKLLWRPHPDLRVSGYEIQRLDPGEKTFYAIADLDGRLNAEYIDRDLDDDALYRYRIVALTCKGQKTAPSQVVTVSTRPLPAMPKKVTASHRKIKKIDLSWEPSASKNVVYYKVYRAHEADSAYGYRAKVKGTHYADKVETDGKHYFYRIAAVDADGLESERTAPVEGDTLAPPKAPKLIGLSVQNGAVVLRWKPSDQRTKSYVLLKKTSTGWMHSSEAQYPGLKTTTFTDPNVVPGREYEYRVLAVDADGLRSEPSQAQSITLEAR